MFSQYDTRNGIGELFPWNIAGFQVACEIFCMDDKLSAAPPPGSNGQSDLSWDPTLHRLTNTEGTDSGLRQGWAQSRQLT